jgi:heme/copper-type cytochrome/quinol oxidase subunit 4
MKMLNFFGYQIETLLFLQLLITAIIIIFYSILIGSQEAKAERLSQRHILLLLNFLIIHHPSIKSLSELAGAEKKELDNSGNHIYRISLGLSRLKNSGELPSIKPDIEHGIGAHLLIVIFAPVYAVVSALMEIGESRRYELHRIIHTELRKNYFSKDMISLIANLLILIIALLFVLPNHPSWGYLILIVSVIAIILLIVEMSAYVWWQMSWKDFWQDKLLDIMASAEKESNHDLFNKAMILKGYIESQPDVPLPGSFSFYVVIFTGVQGILLWLSKYVGF